jgi:hypothetical protein
MKIKLPNNCYHSEAQKTDLQKSALLAMQRAAEEARKIAIQTDTAIVIQVDGQIKHISATELASHTLARPELGI